MSEMIAQDIFERYEVKYLIPKELKEVLLNELSDQIVPDAYGKSTIRNIYYDTKDFRLARISMEKPDYKEKLRLRSYKKANAEDEVFLEMKKKVNGIVYKRRILIPLAQAEGFFHHLCDLPEDQISKEIRYFCEFYKTIRPAVYLNYDRSAYYWKDDPNVRITFDENVQWRTDRLSLKEETGGREILEDGKALLEVKSRGSVPLPLTRLLSKYRVYPASLSKYGAAYTVMTQEKLKEKRKETCLTQYSPQISEHSPYRASLYASAAH